MLSTDHFDAQDKRVDTVCTYTQVKMVDAPNVQNKSESECPAVWIRLPRHQWPKLGKSSKILMFSSRQESIRTPLLPSLLPPSPPAWQDCSARSQFANVLLEFGWEKAPAWECLFVHRQQGLFLSVHVGDIKIAGKKRNLYPMWKRLNETS